MNSAERALIERLFDKIRQAAAQPTPRDPEAEQLINQNVQRIPGAAYYMAQTLVVQRQALKQAEAQIAQLEQHLGIEPGGQGSFLAPQQNNARYGQNYGGQDYGQQPYYNNGPQGRFGGGGFGGGGFGGGGFGGGGFLAGAAQTALGVAGGVLLGNAAMSLFDGVASGVGDLFNEGTDAVASNFQDFQAPADMGNFGEGPVDSGESGGFLDGTDFGGEDSW
ncbi:MAG: periplasmic ligand-binding sensor protein [Chloroflexi bacterium]|nr:periplasmic ligand-binding sensor protein [Chloroflexota bacterium]